jgi:ABC-type glycerol-3-phosphate transport system permease component
VFKAAFEAVPQSLIDAARIDGLTEWRIILRVLLPLSKPRSPPMSCSPSFGPGTPFCGHSSSPASQPCRPSRWDWPASSPTSRIRQGALYAFAVMVLAPSIFVFLMAQKEFIRGLASGATKG